MFALILVLLVCVPAISGQTPSFLLQADAAYARRSQAKEAQTALSEFAAALKDHPDSVEACWKASRTAWWLGDHAESRSEKLNYFQRGIDDAQKALALDAHCVEAHFWLGSNYGSYGEAKGILKSLSLIKPIRQEMAAVNRLNDQFDGGGGYRVLGVVDYKIPGFAGGNKKRALEELQKALAIDPTNPFTHYYLAEYYKTIGEKELMQAEWRTLQTTSVIEDLQPEYHDLLSRGKKLFEK